MEVTFLDVDMCLDPPHPYPTHTHTHTHTRHSIILSAQLPGNAHSSRQPGRRGRERDIERQRKRGRERERERKKERETQREGKQMQAGRQGKVAWQAERRL